MRTGQNLYGVPEMKKTLVFAALCGMLVVGCQQKVKEEPTTGEVTIIREQIVRDEKTGVLSIQLQSIKEIAERSTEDKGAESLMAPQQVAVMGEYFDNFNVGDGNDVVLSEHNQQGQLGADLWILKGGKIRLTKTNFTHNDPSFSRDGKNVYFVSRRGQMASNDHDQLSYVWRIAGSGSGGLTRIGTPMFDIYTPAESPDGNRILLACTEFRTSSPFIWIMEKNGALPTQIKQGEFASWLDNNTIIFQTKDENSGLFTIWTCKTDGSELTQIIADPKLDCLQPMAAPAGAHIAFVKQKSGDNRTRDLYIFGIKDGLVQQITTNNSRDDLPKFSPDGKFLYFRSSRGLKWSIWRLSTNFLTKAA